MVCKVALDQAGANKWQGHTQFQRLNTHISLHDYHANTSNQKHTNTGDKVQWTRKIHRAEKKRVFATRNAHNQAQSAKSGLYWHQSTQYQFKPYVLAFSCSIAVHLYGDQKTNGENIRNQSIILDKSGHMSVHSHINISKNQQQDDSTEYIINLQWLNSAYVLNKVIKIEKL